MLALPTLALSLLSVEMRCDDRECRPVLVPPAGRIPLVHLHPLEVPTEVRPWKPKPPVVPAKPPTEKK